ncbi:MAG: Vacuolar cation-chloride cotransporter 1 [Sclerophora amabilis]|nr:MAG: Vacuolar cation-chloride cotransporter 1 [Sclerophora amabilis]
MSGTSNASRTVPPGIRSSFMTRSATDDAAQLGRRSSALSPPAQSTEHPSHSEEPDNPYEPETYSSQPSPRHFEFTKKVFGQEPSSEAERLRNNESKRSHGLPFLKDHSLTAQMHGGPENKGRNGNDDSPRGVMPRPVGGKGKLGTFSGVFVPTSLNVLSILMFLRFGFILGQGGVLGTMGMLLVSYLINLVTTLSISAIATNGTVRGGGAYYLISRSLGPEFGGSIGIVFYLGFVFNTGMNAVGLVDCLKQNFGVESGNWYNWLPDGFWWDYLWATILLLLCTSICLAGSSIFARASNGLLAILLIATFSIPLSAFIVQPFTSSKLGIEYTGLSAETFMGNMLPKFTKGAAGSQLHSKENFQDLFGILFPATGGIFA